MVEESKNSEAAKTGEFLVGSEPSKVHRISAPSGELGGFKEIGSL